MRELEWLNAYNREVLDKVGPLLRETGDDEAVRCVALRCFRCLSVSLSSLGASVAVERGSTC